MALKAHHSLVSGAHFLKGVMVLVERCMVSIVLFRHHPVKTDSVVNPLNQKKIKFNHETFKIGLVLQGRQLKLSP